MTKQSLNVFYCAVCGWGSLQGVIMSTSGFGSPDLDFRPPPLARFTINLRVQDCPHCGYCASDIEEKIPGAARMVRSVKYLAVLDRRGKRDRRLIRHFLCASMLYENAGDLAAAARMSLNAAWAADDAKEGKRAAQRARRQVLRLVDELHARGNRLEEDPVWEALLLIDIARRAREFDRAKGLIAEVGAGETEPVRNLVAFQHERVVARDTGGYTIEEAMERPAD
jgi:ribosomal protein L37E